MHFLQTSVSVLLSMVSKCYLCCLLMDREALCLELVSPNKRGIFVVIREKNK